MADPAVLKNPMSLFDVRDGSVRQGPATFPEVRYETRASDDGFLEVRATG